MTEEKKKRPTATFVCTGRRVNAKDKFSHTYLRVEDGKTVANMLSFASPLGTGKRGSDIVGGIYKGEYEDDAAYGRWRWVGNYDDKEKVVLWKAKDVEAEAEIRYLKELKEAKGIDPILETLETVRKAYKKTNAVGRRALLAKIVEYVTR